MLCMNVRTYVSLYTCMHVCNMYACMHAFHICWKVYYIALWGKILTNGLIIDINQYTFNEIG